MSKKKYDYDYDDDYRGLGDFSDYDYYYGNPDRGNPDRDNARRGFSRRGKKSDLDYDDNINGSDREEAEVSSGVMYMLMAVCFGVLIISVLFGRMYVSNFVSPNNNTDFLFSSEVNAESEESEQVETVEQKIERELSSMTLEEKVGQLFMVRNNGSKGFKDTVSKTHAGAAILFAADFKGKTPAQVQKMIKGLQDASDGRMIIAVDEEGGDVIRVSGNTKLRKTKFLSPQKLYSQGGLELIKTDTEEKCELLDSLGINMNMAPVADVCTSKKGFMYNRSFGKDAKETSEYVSTVISTMKKTPVASCVKHFPGYGNSKKDTHKGLDINKKTLEQLEESDLVPFETAIDDGVDSILLTHTVVNAFDPIHPASLSSDVVKYIRNEMGFDGLLITDGLEMGAVIKYSGDSGKSCVMAVKAGVDILCAPKNPEKDYKAVLDAVNAGDISEERIDESVRRILRFKQRFPEKVESEETSSTESDGVSTDESNADVTTVTSKKSTSASADNKTTATTPKSTTKSTAKTTAKTTTQSTAKTTSNKTTQSTTQPEEYGPVG